MYDQSKPPFGKRRKKVDVEALMSPLNRIPGLDLPAVRDMIDLGISEVDHLRGRAPEVLYSDTCIRRPATPRERLFAFRLAVYYAETADPERAKLHPSAWQD